MININCILIIDRSASMKILDGDKKGASRWNVMQEWAKDVARELNGLDEDGLDIIFFNSKISELIHIDTEQRIDELFAHYKPFGGTDLLSALEKGINVCMDRKTNERSELLIVITDGNPDAEGTEERERIRDLIANTAKQLKNRNELGIAFVQIGRDEECRTFLVNLDDHIAEPYGVIDIVTTKTYDEINDEEMPLEEIIRCAFNE